VRTKQKPLVLSFTTAAAAGTEISTVTFKGEALSRADLLVVDAVLLGPTGGTLDVYLQRRTGANDWTDWAHFSQVASITASRQSFSISGLAQDILALGGGTAGVPGVGLAVGKSSNVMPGDEVRAVFVSAGIVTAGAAQTITITPYYEYR
jgi:hypothetical protein